MSAYIVEELTITRVLHGLATLKAKSGRSITRDFDALGDFTQIGQLLWDLNENAVYQRYPDDRETKDMGTAGVYIWRGTCPCSLVQSYKSTSCLSYQCAEGDVPETPLFRLLDRLESALADAIVTSMPDYEKADWG